MFLQVRSCGYIIRKFAAHVARWIRTNLHYVTHYMHNVLTRNAIYWRHGYIG